MQCSECSKQYSVCSVQCVVQNIMLVSKLSPVLKGASVEYLSSLLATLHSTVVQCIMVYFNEVSYSKGCFSVV